MIVSHGSAFRDKARFWKPKRIDDVPVSRQDLSQKLEVPWPLSSFPIERNNIVGPERETQCKSPLIECKINKSFHLVLFPIYLSGEDCMQK